MDFNETSWQPSVSRVNAQIAGLRMSISTFVFLTVKRETRPWYSASQYSKVLTGL